MTFQIAAESTISTAPISTYLAAPDREAPA